MNQEEKLRKVFDELDVNKNGYIDLEEVNLQPKILFHNLKTRIYFHIEYVVSFV